MTTQEILQGVHDWTNGKIVYDISVAHPDGQGNPTPYADLTAALGTGGANIPENLRKGGMSVKFIKGSAQSSDNKYVQYRLMADEFSTDVNDWEQSASTTQLEELEDNVVMTGSYDATVAVGLADNLRGDTIVNAEFYKRKTGGTQSVGSGIAAIKEVKGKSIVWNQVFDYTKKPTTSNFGIQYKNNNDGSYTLTGTATQNSFYLIYHTTINHKYLVKGATQGSSSNTYHIRIADINGVELARETGNGVIIQTTNGIDVYMRVVQGVTVNVDFWPQIFDLTLMFGAGNEPATVAEFEKMFPLDYYDFNAGEAIPFAGQNLVTTGKNQYNPATGKANLLGGQTYQLLGTYTGAEIDGVAVTLDSNNCFTTTKDCMLDVTGGNNTDTIVALYNGENVTFEPYEKHTLPLDPSQWRDKQGNLVFPYGGMHGVDTAYDYAKVDADGYIRKAVRCFGQVDLGNLTWTYDTSNVAFYSNDINKKKVAANNVFCSRYVMRTNNVGTNWQLKDKMIGGGVNSKKIYIKDTSYDNAATFKNAMKDEMAYYELATPVEVELATPIYAKYICDKDGTEEITPANGTTPYTTMANLSILYAMNARGEIKNLPKNYLSKESAENMLNAMVSAGVIASYTMTYDAASGRYTFVITKPAE